MSEETTIRRGARNARYTTVPNHVFEDVRLSMEARWLLGYLLSKPDNWTVRMGDIRKKGACGRDKARAMVSELVDAGYMEREDARKSGKFNGLALVIFDEPQGERQPETESVTSLPQTEKPATVEPATANPPLVKTEALAIPEDRIEREREREPEENPKTIEARGWALLKDWPGFAGMPKEPAMKVWRQMTPEDREKAERRFPGWLALLKAQKKSHVPAPSTYFGQKLFDEVPDPQAAAKPLFVEAAPFGPLWMAARLKQLVAGPQVDRRKLTSFEEQLVADGRAEAESLYREKQVRGGWPAVNAMHDRASMRQGVTVATALEPLAGMMEAVPVDSEAFEAWKLEHALRGWPWLPDPGRQPVVYFPAGGPGALSEFDAAVRGNTDDGGNRQAAE
ncbi:helix-turn-helix domain-containing protein [Mesorhizobium sp. WSM2239]|uniref:Helix-turn-helix domain-containing protein n=2 Tax=unclassified Mesorhizobium TaxID=325217 RepID=A0AAU8D282_9HYPH